MSTATFPQPAGPIEAIGAAAAGLASAGRAAGQLLPRLAPLVPKVPPALGALALRGGVAGAVFAGSFLATRFLLDWAAQNQRGVRETRAVAEGDEWILNPAGDTVLNLLYSRTRETVNRYPCSNPANVSTLPPTLINNGTGISFLGVGFRLAKASTSDTSYCGGGASYVTTTPGTFATNIFGVKADGSEVSLLGDTDGRQLSIPPWGVAGTEITKVLNLRARVVGGEYADWITESTSARALPPPIEASIGDGALPGVIGPGGIALGALPAGAPADAVPAAVPAGAAASGAQNVGSPVNDRLDRSTGAISLAPAGAGVTGAQGVTAGGISTVADPALPAARTPTTQRTYGNLTVGQSGTIIRTAPTGDRSGTVPAGAESGGPARGARHPRGVRSCLRLPRSAQQGGRRGDLQHSAPLRDRPGRRPAAPRGGPGSPDDRGERCDHRPTRCAGPAAGRTQADPAADLRRKAGRSPGDGYWRGDRVTSSSQRPRLKRISYRDQGNTSQAQHQAHWAGFQWDAGNVIVAYVGDHGTIQVWASTEAEGRRVIEHACSIAQIPLTGPDAGEWIVTTGKSARTGRPGRFIVPTAEGYPVVTKRPGPSRARLPLRARQDRV